MTPGRVDGIDDEDLLTLLRRQARRYGDKPFITFGDGAELTFGGAERRVAGVRALLPRMGAAPGDRVALMMKNSLFYPVAWLGVLSAGCIAVPINSRARTGDAGFILRHSGASLAIVDEATEPVVSAAAPGIRTFVARSGAGMEDVQDDPDVPAPELSGDAVANIQYTSGTTGFPKGCVLMHSYWQWMAEVVRAYFPLEEHDTILTSQPHSYIDPQWNVVAALRAGARLVLLDGFHPSTFMRSVAEHDVTVFYCLGVMPTLVLKQSPAPWDREHKLQRVFCSAIPVDLHAAIEERYGVPWHEVFGMTESGVNVGVPRTDHDRLVGSGCIGKPLPHNEAAVFDEHDAACPPGKVGELVLRGSGFMLGYHEDPAATEAFYRSGWAHTGDLVEADAEGFLFYRGRKKEMIRRGGENIAPVEIETALTTHPDVVECAACPVPDPDLGEEIKVYIVASREVDPQALQAYLRERIAAFKVPRYWEMRASLPRTPSEKIAKHELEGGRSSFLENTVDVRR